MTTPQILSRLRTRYPSDKGQWASLTEFEQVDFLAVGLWASLKWVVHGHEVKCSRADWLAELREGPAKAAPGRKISDFWWLVAGPGVLRNLDEVPASWGILGVDGNGVRRLRPAVRLRPEPVHEGAMLGVEEGFIEDGGPDWETRRIFAMMARRQMYASADAASLRASLLQHGGRTAVEQALDEAASATRRPTTRARAKAEVKAFTGRRTNGSAEARQIAEIHAMRDEGVITPAEAERRVLEVWQRRAQQVT